MVRFCNYIVKYRTNRSYLMRMRFRSCRVKIQSLKLLKYKLRSKWAVESNSTIQKCFKWGCVLSVILAACAGVCCSPYTDRQLIVTVLAVMKLNSLLGFFLNNNFTNWTVNCCLLVTGAHLGIFIFIRQLSLKFTWMTKCKQEFYNLTLPTTTIWHFLLLQSDNSYYYNLTIPTTTIWHFLLLQSDTSYYYNLTLPTTTVWHFYYYSLTIPTTTIWQFLLLQSDTSTTTIWQFLLLQSDNSYYYNLTLLLLLQSDNSYYYNLTLLLLQSDNSYYYNLTILLLQSDTSYYYNLTLPTTTIWHFLLLQNVINHIILKAPLLVRAPQPVESSPELHAIFPQDTF